MIINKHENFKDEYCATILRIGEIHPIEGADRVVKIFANGNSVVIGKDEFKEGDVAVYVSVECTIHELFLHLNSMFEDRELNVNPEQKGYINKHGRVRCVKLRGVPSLGILLSPQSIATFLNEPVEDVVKFLENHVGEDFDMINGERFVKVYVPPVKENTHVSKGDKRNARLKRFKMLMEGTFRFHYSTAQLGKEIHNFSPDDVVYISNKLHGCVERHTIVDTMEYGQKTIGEIVDNKIDCHIKAYDTNADKIVYVPIDNFYMIPNDGEWYEIELEDGRKITITGNNPVWLPVEKCYRRVDELNGDEYFLID